MAARNYSGRHGSGAWLRWFKRRYRSTTLPVVQNQLMESFSPVVVVFQTERIIFIMITPSFTDPTPDDDNDDDTQNFAPVPYKSRQIESSTEQHLISLIESAEVAAQTKADMLVDQEIEDKGSEANFFKNRLKLKISGLFDEFFRGLPAEERRSITREIREKLRESFEYEFFARINKKVQGYREEGILEDENALKIREWVHQDKPDFKNLNPPELLRYLAAVRAINDVLKITADVTLEDLHNIRDYVEKYRKQYDSYDFDKEVTNRSNGTSFPARG